MKTEVQIKITLDDQKEIILDQEQMKELYYKLKDILESSGVVYIPYTVPYSPYIPYTPYAPYSPYISCTHQLSS